MYERRRYAAALLLAPALVLLIGLLVWPLSDLTAASFSDPRGPFVFYMRLWSVSSYGQILLRTLLFSAATAGLCLLLGYPVAYVLARVRPLTRSIILVCVMLPFWTNILVRCYGWIIFLNPKGILNEALISLGLVKAPLDLIYNVTGVLVGMTQIMLPYMILPLYAVMTRLDERVVNAARSLGAGPVSAFVKIYFPLTFPGVMAGLLLVFAISLGFYVIPALLGGASGMVLAQVIDFNINGSLNWGMAAALSTVLLMTTLAIFWIGDRWFNLGVIWGVQR